jgi:type I restriction enzyme S subunit
MELIPTGSLKFSNFDLRPMASISSGTYFEDGDLLLSKITPCFENGKQGIARSIPNGFGFATTEVIPIKARERITYLPFVAYYLLHQEVRSLLAGSMEGATGRQRLPKDVLAEWPLPVPPLDEQRAIASVLDNIQAAAQLESVICQKSTALKSATMAKLFREGLRGEPLKQLDFGDSPESWRLTSLSDVAEVQTGVAKGRKFDDTDIVEVPYLRVANVQDGHLDLSEMKTLQIRRAELERYTLHDGDVVLTEGGDFDKLGRGFIWRSELPLCIHQNHVFAVRTNRSVLDPEFFAYLAQSPYGKAYFLQVAHKTTNLACINSNKLKAFPVLVPRLEEQKQIVAILDGIDQEIQVHMRKHVALDNLFKSLLQKLMTGAIRVKGHDLAEVSHG